MKRACFAAMVLAALGLGGCASAPSWPPPEMSMENPAPSKKPVDAYAGRERTVPLHETPFRTWYPRGADPYY